MKFSQWSRINQNQSTILTRKIRGISGWRRQKFTGHPTMRSKKSQKSGKEQVEESPEGLLRWAPTERAIMYYPSMTRPLWSFRNQKNKPSPSKLHRSLHRICSILWVTRIFSSLSETVPLESTTCIPTSPLKQETEPLLSQQRNSTAISTAITVSQLAWRNWAVWEAILEAASSIYTGLRTQVKNLWLRLPLRLTSLALRTSEEWKSSLRMKNVMTWYLMLRPRERAYSSCIKTDILTRFAW